MNAPDKATEIKAFLAAILAFGTALWGWLGWAIITLIICMALDWVTGSWAARRKGEWSSAIARDGLWHKLGEIAALLVAALCDIAIQVVLHSTASEFLDGYEYGHYFTMLVAIWYIFTEAGSIIENAGELGAPIPGWLRKGVAVLRRKFDAAAPTDDAPDLAEDQEAAKAALKKEVDVAAAAEEAADPEPEDLAAMEAFAKGYEPPAPPSTGSNAQKPAEHVSVRVEVQTPESAYEPKHAAAKLCSPPDLPEDLQRDLPADLVKAYLEMMDSEPEPEDLDAALAPQAHGDPDDPSGPAVPDP